MSIPPYATRSVLEYPRPSRIERVCTLGEDPDFGVSSIQRRWRLVVLSDPAARHFTDENVDKLFIAGRDLHSFSFQLNLSAFYVIGGARRGCVACVISGSVRVCRVCRDFSSDRHGLS